MSRKFVNDENAAATEIGYVFTFLLGLMFLTTFSIWVWGLEVSTQERWTEHALEENLLSVGAAVERADEAARRSAIACAIWGTRDLTGQNARHVGRGSTSP